MTDFVAEDYPTGSGSSVNCYPASAETYFVEIYLGQRTDNRVSRPVCSIRIEGLEMNGGPAAYDVVKAALEANCLRVSGDGFTPKNVGAAQRVRQVCARLVLDELVRNHKRFFAWLAQERASAEHRGAQNAMRQLRELIGVEE